MKLALCLTTVIIPGLLLLANCSVGVTLSVCTVLVVLVIIMVPDGFNEDVVAVESTLGIAEVWYHINM